MAELSWWTDFMSWLVEAVPRSDWPASTVFWGELADQVVIGVPNHELSFEACRAGARRLAREGFPFPGDLHRALPEAILAVIRDVRTEEFRRARADSAGCPDCGGGGFASRKIMDTGDLARYYPDGRVVSVCCPSCPLGSLIRADEERRVIAEAARG